MDKPKNTGKAFEKLVHNLLKQLSPQATITLDDRIRGKSGILRKIDVSIRQPFPPYKDILIIVDAKDFSKPVDNKAVSKLADDVDDVGAERGILISPKGFTKLAVERAKKRGVTLFTAHDSESIDWKNEITIPVLWESISIGDYLIDMPIFSFSDPKTNQILNKIPEVDTDIIKQIWFIPFYYQFKKTNLMEQFLLKYDADYFLRVPNKKITLEFGIGRFLYKDELINVGELKLKYKLKKRYFIKNIVPDVFKGLVEYDTKEIKPLNLTFKDKIPNLEENDWEEIDEKEVKTRPSHLNIQIWELKIFRFMRFIDKVI